MNARTLLQAILGDCDLVGLSVPATEGKRVFPSAVHDEADRLALIDQHLAGQIAGRECRRSSDGHTWTESRAIGLHGYCLRARSEGTMCGWLALDIDAGDHKAGSDELAAKAARAACSVIVAQGLPYLLAQSGGGRGFHVWVLFDREQDSGFAHWLAGCFAATVVRMVPGAHVEALPKQRTAAIGCSLALPCGGNPAGAGGGRLLWPEDFSDRDAATVETVTGSALAKLQVRYDESERTRVSRVEAEQREARRRAFRNRGNGRDPLTQFARYLEAVPPAVEGANGDDHTLRVAMLAGDFGLSPDAAFSAMSIWNARCDPPWTDRELRSKLHSAARSRRTPIGCKLGMEVARG